MNNELAKDINAFLFDRSRREYIYEDNSYSHSLLKSYYDDDTDFLYHLDEYQNPQPQSVGGKAEYAGIISYKRTALFDPAFCMRSWIKESPDRGALVKSVTEKIRAEIGRIVDDKPVEVTPAAETSSREDREYFLKYKANGETYQAFFAGQTTVVYDPYFALSNPSTADYVRIINDEEGFIADKAQMYIVKKANVINNRLWEVGVVNERLAGLISSPGEHHVRRVIADSIGNDMKMVNVHIEKDDQSGIFKVQPHSVLREARDNSYISTYSMDAPSKRQFEKMFGRHEALRYSDFMRITYGKKILYQREGAIPMTNDVQLSHAGKITIGASYPSSDAKDIRTVLAIHDDTLLLEMRNAESGELTQYCVARHPSFHEGILVWQQGDYYVAHAKYGCDPFRALCDALGSMMSLGLNERASPCLRTEPSRF